MKNTNAYSFAAAASWMVMLFLLLNVIVAENVTFAGTWWLLLLLVLLGVGFTGAVVINREPAPGPTALVTSPLAPKPDEPRQPTSQIPAVRGKPVTLSKAEGAVETGVPAQDSLAMDGEQRQTPVNVKDLETPAERAKKAETGDKVADEVVTEEDVRTGELTDSPPTSPQEKEAQRKVLNGETEADSPQEEIPVAPGGKAKPKAAEKAPKPDDLKRIEGIGPKMSKALIAQGIDTFEKLSKQSEETLRAAIAAEGMRFAPAAESWAEQASYAARGDWEGLEAFQNTLTAGRYPDKE